MVDSNASRQTAKQVEIGKVIGVFGVKGWLKILSYCHPREQITEYPTWHLQPAGEIFNVETVHRHGKGLIAKLQTVDDRTQAQAMQGKVIAITRDVLPQLAEQEHYWCELIGLEVMNVQGDYLGTIKRLVATEIHDIAAVRNPQTGIDYLIPYVHQVYIKDVNLELGKMLVAWDKDWVA